MDAWVATFVQNLITQHELTMLWRDSCDVGPAGLSQSSSASQTFDEFRGLWRHVIGIRVLLAKR